MNNKSVGLKTSLFSTPDPLIVLKLEQESARRRDAAQFDEWQRQFRKSIGRVSLEGQQRQY